MKNRKLPEGWKVEKLDTLCVDKFAGDWGSNDEEKKGVFVIRTTNFTDDGNLNFNDVVTRCIDDKVIKKKRLQFGDIILEKSGGSDNQPVGRVVYFNKTDGIYMCNNFTHVLRINKEKAVPKYVMYFLLDIHKKGITKYFQNKTTGIRNLQMKRYFKLGIELPPLEIQKKIVQALEKAEDALKKKKESIRLLDELVKSRFIEMFGDPVSLLETSKTITVKDMTNDVSVGFVGESTNEYVDRGIPYLRMQNIHPMKIDDQNLIYINEEFHKKIAKANVFANDIVISRVGINRGMTAVISKQFNNSSIGNAIIIRASNTFNSLFVAFYINMIFGKHTAIGYSKGSAQGAISVGLVKKWPIPDMPLRLQNQFADFVRQVDKLKFEMKKSLKNEL